MSKLLSSLWIGGSILLSLAGFAAFFLLFLPDFNVYWFIVSPLVIAVYQMPAVGLYYLYRKHKRKAEAQDGEEKDRDRTPPSADKE